MMLPLLKLQQPLLTRHVLDVLAVVCESSAAQASSTALQEILTAVSQDTDAEDSTTQSAFLRVITSGCIRCCVCMKERGLVHGWLAHGTLIRGQLASKAPEMLCLLTSGCSKWMHLLRILSFQLPSPRSSPSCLVSKSPSATKLQR
jgi:hypothetical protein